MRIVATPASRAYKNNFFVNKGDILDEPLYKGNMIGLGGKEWQSCSVLYLHSTDSQINTG